MTGYIGKGSIEIDYSIYVYITCVNGWLSCVHYATMLDFKLTDVFIFKLIKDWIFYDGLGLNMNVPLYMLYRMPIFTHNE